LKQLRTGFVQGLARGRSGENEFSTGKEICGDDLVLHRQFQFQGGKQFGLVGGLLSEPSRQMWQTQSLSERSMGNDVLDGDIVGSLQVLKPLEIHKQSLKGAPGDRDGRGPGADELPRGKNEKGGGAPVMPNTMFQGREPFGVVFGIPKVFGKGRTLEAVADVGGQDNIDDAESRVKMIVIVYC
jgi:hypothetical protein